ncbi:hypothetical protein H072_5180 [Dactylellina haptotyla CBS 200.50]|uniref:NAD(P)-binding protein n=1 Tax=Dactylellina haptotyla (strain CBS 200.50) TaxID=1284197 RepID=S8AIG3_DACHA|nr:hypothetical protein H072_5180 [Dactylellina haptotyla CBS 200.50]
MAETPVIILTGAGRGIGKGVLNHLLALPNPPNILAVSRDITPLEPLAEAHDNLEVVSLDFSAPFGELKTQIPSAIIDVAVAKWGRIDSLLLNHGILDPVAKMEDARLESWDLVYRVNLFSNVEMIKAALPELRKSRGRVVMVSSAATEMAFNGWSAYGSSKAALNHLALTLAHEEPEITTISIAPGVVDTDMQKDIRQGHGNTMTSQEHSMFVGLKENGILVSPDTVGSVLGNLSLKLEKGLSGKYLHWDNEALAAYR